MIIVSRTATISPGKKEEAVELWTRFAKHLNKQNPERKYTVITPFTGERPDRITIFSWHDSLTAWDGDIKKNRADPEFRALRKEHKEKQYTEEILTHTVYEVAE